MSIPNILHASVPQGEDESGNTTHSVHGSKPDFNFKPKTHNEIISINNWVDLKRAAKITGSRFFFLKGDLARLELALQTYAVDFIRQRDYTFVQPPVMMNRQAYEGVTDLSDFGAVMYGIEPDKYYMIATSEHPLTAMYMGETIPENQLPLGLSVFALAPSKSVHTASLTLEFGACSLQIEQIVISKPEDSWQIHEELLQNCVDLWNDLGLRTRWLTSAQVI